MQTHRLAHWLISRLSKGDKKKVRKLLYHSLRTNMAAGEGFEPSHTESESAVLPLHNPAKRKCYYTWFCGFVKPYFSNLSQKINP